MIEKIKRVDLWEAEKILLSRKQRYFTKATRKDFEVGLVGNYLVCPYCNREFVANSNYFLFKRNRKLHNVRVPKERIREWSSKQISFFDEEHKENTIYISTPLQPFNIFECPKCKRTSKFSENTRQIKINRDKQKVQLCTEIIGLEEIFALKWASSDVISITFPMYEIITFDIGEGKVFLKMVDKNDDIISEREVTMAPELLEGSATDTVINSNTIVSRIIMRFFREVWGMNLPYTSKEITIENLFKMTAFVGYQREFYSGIPYTLNTMSIDETFKDDVIRLHNATNVEKIFRDSSLPQVKSIKRMFYKETSLLFYLEEAIKIWNIVLDYNLFCEILSVDCVYEMLADLHTRPGMLLYINDYCKLKGTRALIKSIAANWSGVAGKAIDYSCMSDVARNKIQEEWKKKNDIDEFYRKKHMYSIPMHKPEQNIKDCNIDGYSFKWLLNSNEYFIAGEKLENCLGSWNAQNSPVVCVKKNKKYVAAIEVKNGYIIQARGCDNSCIESDPQLYAAYEKWKKAHNLEVYDDDLDDDDDE